jgi:SH3-like domain-containing protein
MTIKDLSLVIGQIHSVCKVMLFLPAFRGRAPVFALVALALASGFAALPALAQDNPSGLPLPRWVSTRSNPINVRVGPGTRYEIAWNFIVSGIPVEVVQEFDTWRKIRDVEGDEGWVHQSLLTGTRVGYATPLIANGEVAMHASADENAGVRARLAPNVKVTISECDGSWCQVQAGQPGERQNFSGWVRQEELWGVYPDEVFD